MALIKFAFLSLLSLAIAAKDATQPPATDPAVDEQTSQGCFSALPGSYRTTELSYNSAGTCNQLCRRDGSAVALLHDDKCYCADVYPPKKSLVDDKQCNIPCPGYPVEACGGKGAYSVYNTGVELVPGEDSEDGTTTEASAKSTATTASEKTATPTTKAEGDSTPVTKADHASKTADAASDTNAPSTPSPSASTIPNNAARRLSSPIGIVIGLVRQLL